MNTRLSKIRMKINTFGRPAHPLENNKGKAIEALPLVNFGTFLLGGDEVAALGS